MRYTAYNCVQNCRMWKAGILGMHMHGRKERRLVQQAGGTGITSEEHVNAVYVFCKLKRLGAEEERIDTY